MQEGGGWLPYIVCVRYNEGCSGRVGGGVQYLGGYHQKSQICVMNNGISTGYFNLERGTRQGDPLSHIYLDFRDSIYSNQE